MHFQMNSNGSFDGPSSNQIQQNHQVYMYPPPPPPPPASSGSQAQLITMPETIQSRTNLSYLYPSSQGSSQQFHCHLPPVSMLPPPPPLPPGAVPPFHSLTSFPARSLEPPGMPLPPPPPLPSSSQPVVVDNACEKPEAAKVVVCDGVQGPIVVDDTGSSKESSIHCDESSLPFEKAEHGSPLCTDPDIEMEDDITLPENENYSSQPLNNGSDHIRGAYLNTEQPPPQPVLAETNSINLQTELPGLKSYAQIHQDRDDGSRQASSSPYSGRAKIVPKCSLGDMYDPFVDSFEPAAVKLDCVQKHEPANDSCIVPKASISSNRPLDTEENNQDVDKQALSESDMTARVSVSSNKPPDVEEKTVGNDIEAVASGDNDEFGENAENEREGNSHETGTPNSHNENPKEHEVDSTTRKKSRGDPKEKESSRSMRHFKVVLTKFVKDVLKPSWRQGNMSKEAFKTIVKRVVEKVSNSMEGRRIPKSRAKIDKYIDTSRHKLTKLVMGYVDKYVKA